MRELLITSRDNQAALVEIVRDGFGGSGESSGATAKWTKRFHAKHQSFICFVSSQDPLVAPLEPATEYKQLLESNQKQAAQLVQFNINQQRNGSQVVDNALATMLFNASFIKTANSEGLSIFYSVPAPILVSGGTTTMGADELDLRLKSNNLTGADIKKLTASQIQIPKDEHGFMSTLENHMILVDYLFEQGSILYQSLDKLRKAIEDNKAAFASMVAIEKNYLASLMAAIDVKAQLFFTSCAKAVTIDNVNFIVLDLQSEIEGIWFKRALHVQLPFQVSQLIAATNKVHAAEAVADAKKHGAIEKRPSPNAAERRNRGKRNKKDDVGAQDPAVNTLPADPSWIKPGESVGIFHKNISTVPKMNGHGMCVKFHVQGSCPLGRACIRSPTHTGTLDEETKKKFGNWVDKCRAEAKKN